MAPIRLANAAKFDQQLPHQLAAWQWLQEQITAKLGDEALEEFAVMYRADPALKLSDVDPQMAWCSFCVELVKHFEGCRLTAYPDPGTGDKPWTIGWGTTAYEDARPVKPGDTITQLQADSLLLSHLNRTRTDVIRLLPMASQWTPQQQAALISFTYNIGVVALQNSTLRKRLLAGEVAATVVAEELPRWNKPVEVMEGLTRRRTAEVALFLGKPEPAKQARVLLQVPYEWQLDNGPTGTRECFSSSCAMVARYYNRVFSDDEYNRIRRGFGDTTDVQAQLQTLAHLDLKASFHQNGDVKTLEALLRNGQPVPVGWLHKGPVEHPNGGGHWTVVIGFDDLGFYHNDPNGEARMVEGGYISNTAASGKSVRYSRANWLRRWLVEGSGSGWYLNVSNP